MEKRDIVREQIDGVIADGLADGSLAVLASPTHTLMTSSAASFCSM